MNFLKKLFLRQPNYLPFPQLESDELCQVKHEKSIDKQTVIHVDTNQIAILYHDSECTPLFSTGAHYLGTKAKKFIKLNSKCNILYIKTSPSTIRNWVLTFMLPTAELIALSGQYEVKVENATILANNLLQPEYQHPCNEVLDEWIETLIKEIMQTQNINQNDVDNHSERLVQFLIEAMSPILADKGLSLVAVNFHGPQPPQEKTESFSTDSSQTDSDLATTDKESLESRTTVVEFQRPRVYYRVKHGKQIGPLSTQEVQQLIDNKELRKSDLIWQKGLSAWQCADTFDHFQWPEN